MKKRVPEDLKQVTKLAPSPMGCTLFLILACFIIPSASLGKEYKKQITSHFVFYYTPQDRAIIKDLIDRSEQIRAEVFSDLGTGFKGKTSVYMPATAKDLHSFQPGRNLPVWCAGAAYPALNLIIIKSPRMLEKGSLDLLKVFKHEFTHIALGKAFQGREHAPRWLDEGLAMYESGEWRLSRASSMTWAVLTRSLIPLSEITRSFPLDGKKAELAYTQSFYLVSYLISQYGRENFHSFIAQYSGGRGLEESLISVYNIGERELEERWLKHLRSRFSWVPIVTSATALWFLVTFVFLIAYLKKRRQTRLKFEEWEREEQQHSGTF